jgi:Ran GTPase-activating protein (RanGAP) involved in mRNA processing and transport
MEQQLQAVQLRPWGLHTIIEYKVLRIMNCRVKQVLDHTHHLSADSTLYAAYKTVCATGTARLSACLTSGSPGSLAARTECKQPTPSITLNLVFNRAGRLAQDCIPPEEL